MLQEEEAEIAKQLAKPEYAEFKASSGWLEKWKNAHGISQRSVEEKSGEIPIQTIEASMERLPEICRGYKLEDIWDMDESGCFFVHCQTDVFRKKGGIAREANTQKFVAFIVGATGGKVTEPIVIWKSKIPRCFRYLEDKSRPANLHYFSNEKSWMNTDIMVKILSMLVQR